MSEEQGNIAQHSLAPLRQMDTKLDGALARLSMLEQRSALKDEEAVLDRIAMVELRRRVELIERRLDLADLNPPPAA